MSGDQPLIWVLEGERAGDNAQARELAARVGGRIEARRLRYKHRFRKVRNFLLGASLITLDREASDPLAAPWPDLVIGVGRRSVPVARWIRKQSGGVTRLVQIGRPRAKLNLFDLIVTTPQYGLPAAPNVIELTLPITPKPLSSDAENESWRTMLASLPEPKIAVLVGGAMRPLVMGEAEIATLARDAAELAQRLGGSLIVIGSPRTPSGLVESMDALLTVPHRVFPWKKEAPNPYRPVMGIAQQFIVTSDSVLMLTEALGTGKPVDVFRLPAEKRRRLPLTRWPFSALVRMGLLSTKRNVDAFIMRLAATGHVGVLGVKAGGRNWLSRDDDLVIERIQRLLTGKN